MKLAWNSKSVPGLQKGKNMSWNWLFLSLCRFQTRPVWTCGRCLMAQQLVRRSWWFPFGFFPLFLAFWHAFRANLWQKLLTPLQNSSNQPLNLSSIHSKIKIMPRVLWNQVMPFNQITYTYNTNVLKFERWFSDNLVSTMEMVLEKRAERKMDSLSLSPFPDLKP